MIIREVLLHCGFPERIDGMDVLDVGRGSGFFAFDFEPRRAAVTATDICSFLDWDFVGGDEQREARRKAIADVQWVYRRAHQRGVRVCQRGEEVACPK
jgi:alpha-D-ribose 1-methylphosphonate 5-triphosphate synthase subunit PhnG